jgi:hypothetical protein
MTENASHEFVRLYLDPDGDYRATIMDDLDVHVGRDSVVTIAGPIGGHLQIDLDDAADLAEVLAEVGRLRSPGSTARAIEA